MRFNVAMWFLVRDSLTNRFWQHKNVVGGHVSLDWDQWRVELVFADIAGRTECVGLALIGNGTDKLTSSVLRKVPLTRLVQQTRRRSVSSLPSSEINLEIWTGSVPGIQDRPVSAIKRRVAEGLSAPEKGRQWYDTAHNQRVADEYDFALREGLNTTHHVQEALNLKTLGQARKHIWRARKAGLLPPTDERIPKGNEL